MKNDKMVLSVLVVLAVIFLGLVLVLMKSVFWALFPLGFAALALVCYGVDSLMTKNNRDDREA
ncbi:hypothetical protein FD13_GL002093 [Levilactobacillus senmaizukei DSM 21775 = NBRC 103853]|uniref:Uncharacterized protein n=1 Tax=Levilactobacillus senmaizukei DSM 21775 = NBRC 103853 TaxID=1423803 RepID=A0A0R2DPK3_9LACO|nr:hypothetical protein [Levilactobacillus senmaizukei]KRN02220.1 hypothetical protein FD13_GL002093 [Levilactobacillus senmaizukei DSM 21775 = NBRC 103853]